MPNFIIKNYEHFNKSFGNWDTPHGVHVKSKDHYDRLMKEGNYTSYDQAKENDKYLGKKPYVTSKKALEIIRCAKATADKKGNVKLSDRTLDAMKEIGAIGKKTPDYMKTKNLDTKKGGFYK